MEELDILQKYVTTPNILYFDPYGRMEGRAEKKESFHLSIYNPDLEMGICLSFLLGNTKQCLTGWEEGKEIHCETGYGLSCVKTVEEEKNRVCFSIKRNQDVCEYKEFSLWVVFSNIVVKEEGIAYLEITDADKTEFYYVPLIKKKRPPCILRFSPVIATVRQGEKAVLKWETTGANYCVINPGNYKVGACGTMEIEPRESMRYPVFAIGKELEKSQFEEAKGVFAGCEEIERIVFPKSARKIGEGAFYHCTSLTEVRLPDNIKKLSKDCFRECSALINIQIQGESIEIGENAFFGCSRLRAAAIWAKQLRAETYCFHGCDELSEIFFHSKDEVKFLEDSLKNLEEKKLIMLYQEQGGADVSYKYEIHKENQTVSILKYKGAEEKVMLPTYIAGLPVTEIKKEAFLNNSSISQIIFSSTIKQVGEGAFKGCLNLEQVVLSKHIEKLEQETFSMCIRLKQIDMPSGMIEIGKKAFLGCGMCEIELPEKLEKIAQGAFLQCRELKRILFPENLQIIEREAFADCCSLKHIMLPSKITVVYESTFKNCTHLKSVIYQNPDCEKQEGAFLSCSLESETICETIPAQIEEEYIYAIDEKKGEATFIGYIKNMEEVSIPKYVQGFPVTAISDVAFAWKPHLKQVMIGNNIQNIGSMAFYGCENLEEVVFSQEEAPRIYKEAFFCLEKAVIYVENEKIKQAFCEENCTCPVFCTRGMVLGERVSYQFQREQGLLRLTWSQHDVTHLEPITRLPWQPIGNRIRKVTVESGISSIGAGFFENCYELEQITFSDTVTRIEQAAFKNCKNLSELRLPEELSYIGEEAFFGCTSLIGRKEAVFLMPDSLEEIDKKAFYGCNGLEYLVFPKSVQKIGTWAFRKCVNLSEIYMEHLKKPKKMGSEVFFETAPECEISMKFKDADMLEEKFDNDVMIHVPMEGTCGREGEENQIIWKLYYDGLLEISGEGAMEDYNGTTTPWYEYSAEIQKVSIGGSITHIGAMAFHSCGFAAIDLPDSLKTIGMEAFAYCGNLTFIKIPKEVEEIGISSFLHCKKLNKVLFLSESGCCTIGVSAFREIGRECIFYTSNEEFGKRLSLSYKSYSLMEIQNYEKREIKKDNQEIFTIEACLYKDGLLVVGGSKHAEDIRLSKEQEWFWQKTDFEKEKIKTVFLSSKVLRIGSQAFTALSNLNKVIIEGKLEKIEQDAFDIKNSDISFYVNNEMSERILKYAGIRNVSREK